LINFSRSVVNDQCSTACNGWQFWNLDVEGRLVSIDVLRQKLRAELN
jgi:modification methylase